MINWIWKSLTLVLQPTRESTNSNLTEAQWPTWHPRSKKARPTMELKSICSRPESSSSLLFKAFSLSRKPKKMSTFTICFWLASLSSTGRRQVARISQMSSRTSSLGCLAMTGRRDRPLRRLRAIHGCNSHSLPSWRDRTSRKNFKRKELRRLLIHQDRPQTREEIKCSSSWDRHLLKTSINLSSMTWLITTSKSHQMSFGKSSTASARTILMASSIWS